MIFATGNKGKIREAREILGVEVQSPADLGIFDDPEETGGTFRENSLIKARSLYDKTGLDCFADDSGLEVDALGGAPGIYSARYAMMGTCGADHDFESNIDRLLHELSLRAGEPRTARFRCVVTLIKDGRPQFFEGCCEGSIALHRSGHEGFGYDPVFIPAVVDGVPNVENLTMADLGEDVKNAISHRGQALRQMAAFLAGK